MFRTITLTLSAVLLLTTGAQANLLNAFVKKASDSNDFIIIAKCTLKEPSADENATIELFKRRNDATQGLILVENTNDMELKIGNDVVLSRDGDTHVVTLKDDASVKLKISKTELSLLWNGEFLSVDNFTCKHIAN